MSFISKRSPLGLVLRLAALGVFALGAQSVAQQKNSLSFPLDEAIRGVYATHALTIRPRLEATQLLEQPWILQYPHPPERNEAAIVATERFDLEATGSAHQAIEKRHRNLASPRSHIQSSWRYIAHTRKRHVEK